MAEERERISTAFSLLCPKGYMFLAKEARRMDGKIQRHGISRLENTRLAHAHNDPFLTRLPIIWRDNLKKGLG